MKSGGTENRRGQPYRLPAPPPDEPPAPPVVRDLGPIQSRHRVPRSTLLYQFVLFVGPFLLYGAIAVGGAGAAVGAGTGSLAFLLFRYSWFGLEVELHRDGVVVRHRGRSTPVAFEDVDVMSLALVPKGLARGLFCGATRGGESPLPHPLFEALSGTFLGLPLKRGIAGCRLITHERSAHLVPLPDDQADAVAATILSRCSAPLIDEALEALERGGSVRLSAVVFHPETIEVGGLHLKYAAISDVEVSMGHATIYTRPMKKFWRELDLSTLLQPDLFLRLLKDRVGQRLKLGG